ncbi:14069_t:CDS:2 [Cetraspora pellucida]|uniref:14069_t:CDS:1 n=1 Tax=Cetraspora pellucida TaxID=1433469 RepID=A0ACA9LUX1_9GLOM|nr:14069_t:CDS:2 [Cetraspora pellucida]
MEICCLRSDIQITKCVFNLNNTSIEYDNCTKYIQRSRVRDNIYCYLFENNHTDFFGNPDLNVTGPWKSRKLRRFICKLKSQMTAFTGIQNMSTMAYFTKHTIQSILPHDTSAIFGVAPNYHNVSYINVISKNFPMHPNDNVSVGIFDGHFNVAPGSFIHDVQSEKLSHTVIIALGVLGGGFGLMSGIYILLFGQPRNNPWGLMHLIMKPKIESDGYRNIDLSNMPFVSKTNSIIEDHIPTEKKVIRLENRILALEKILEDYVINPYALKFLKLTPEEHDKN